jgi:hypothetical protein
VIALVNDAFVPVWIDVRTMPIPALPAVDRALGGMNIELDADRHVVEKHRGFLLMSLVTTSDGAILLNPEATDHPVGMLFEQGHFPYARVKPDQYLAMLRKSLSYLHPEVVRSP